MNGTLNGPAEFFGANGDRLEFSYQDGKKFGGMTYFFTDGCIERSFFDEQGLQSGPTQFTWPSGAKREGHKVGLELVMRFACLQSVNHLYILINIFHFQIKVNGKWEGQVFYLYAEGPRKGKRDVETWKNGEMVSSQKYYGEGETISIQNWEDLKKLEELGNERTPEKEVFYDCISNTESDK